LLVHYVHLLLEELRISLKSSLSTTSIHHTVCSRVEVGVWFWAHSKSGSPVFRARFGVGVLHFQSWNWSLTKI